MSERGIGYSYELLRRCGAQELLDVNVQPARPFVNVSQGTVHVRA